MGKHGSATTHIKATPEAVYALISDVTRMGEWSPETVKAEWIDGATGPAPGARFKGTNKAGPIRWSTTPKVTVCDPGREFTFVLGFAGQEFVVWRYRFEPVDDGTDVTESFTVRGYALYGLLRPRRREQQLVDGMRATLLELKRFAEANA